MSSAHWFGEPALTIFKNMGFSIEPGKVRNIISLAEGELDLWYFLCLMPAELREEHGDEWANIILGPIAAGLKAQGLDFKQHDRVLSAPGLLMLFEAMALGLVPKSVRRALYEALVNRFNVEFYEAIAKDNVSSEEIARMTFYGILGDVVEPIFSEVGADELTEMIRKVLEANPKQAVEAKDDPKVVGWLMGQVMRSSPTKMNPNTVRAAILENL